MKKIIIVSFCLVVSQCCLAQHWDTLGTGLSDIVTKMYSDSVSNKLFVSGLFTTVDDAPIRGIATWDGVRWDSLGHGLDNDSTNSSVNSIWAMERYGNYIYVGGNFFRTGLLYTPSFARWDGLNWDSVPGYGTKLYRAIRDIVTYGNNLYICGGFDSVGNIAATNIAEFDGVSWQAIGNNYDFRTQYNTLILSRIKFYNGNLYVAGTFNDTAGHTCRLAKWDGNNWQFFTNNVRGSFADIEDMEVYNNKLYVAGLFYTADGNAGNSIMCWNDTAWSNVGGSVDVLPTNTYPTITDMCVHNGKLYCVGNFEKVGGVPAIGLASWDGTNWCGYGTNFSNKLTQITFFHDSMYIGGGFSDYAGDTGNFVAKWVGGSYVSSCGNTTGIPIINSEDTINIFPNPTSGLLHLRITGLKNEAVQIRIVDVLGQTVMEKKYGNSTGEREDQLDVSVLNSGIYFVSVQVGDRKMHTKKIVKQ